MNRKEPARGSKGRESGKYAKRTIVSFPDEMFDAVRSRALKAGVSFTEQVRLYVQWGLENDDQGS